MAAQVLYVKSDAAGGGDGSSWVQAWNETEFEHDITTAAAGHVEAGDIYYIMEGSYTLGGAVTVGNPGTAANPITLIGVKSGTSNTPPVYTDYADTNLSVSATDERPVFTCAANIVTFTNYCKVYNLVFNGSGTSTVVTGTTNILYNVKSTNSGAATRYAFNVGANTTLIKCAGASTSGYAFYSVAAGCALLFCYLYNSVTGIYITVNAPYTTIAFCGFTDSGFGNTGINMLASYGIRILNCSFWGLATAVSASSAYGCVCINNALQLISSDGFIWTTKEDINFFFNNHIGLDVADAFDKVEEAAMPHMDPEVTSNETGWTTTGNFSLTPGSPCEDTGMSASFYVGL